MKLRKNETYYRKLHESRLIADIIQAVSNIQKAFRLVDRVEVIVRDRKSAWKLRELKESPMKG